MAKEFYTNGIGSAQILNPSDESKIKIYPTEAAADADLANLEENEIFATDEDNNPASGTQYPVDVVQEDNMNAVTSNAVYDSVVSRPRFPDYARGNLFTGQGNSYTATEDCYIIVILVSTSSAVINVDGVEVSACDSITNLAVTTFSGFLKEGQTISTNVYNAFVPVRFKVFGLIGE